MTIRWGSLIATVDGEIDQSKLKSLTAIALAWIGGLVLGLIMAGLLKAPTDIVMVGVGALVLPLTGGIAAGKVADAISNRIVPPPPNDIAPSPSGTAP